jgi:hypothetical protein
MNFTFMMTLEFEITKGGKKIGKITFINLQKSEIFFSKNMDQATKELNKGILQVSESIGTGKYLGLPSMVGRKKKAIFNHIRDRIWKRIQSWKGKHLSKAGREVLIESVAQSIPTYCMSSFLLPTTLADEIQKNA